MKSEIYWRKEPCKVYLRCRDYKAVLLTRRKSFMTSEARPISVEHKCFTCNKARKPRLDETARSPVLLLHRKRGLPLY